jgi:hypothetical protein
VQVFISDRQTAGTSQVGGATLVGTGTTTSTGSFTVTVSNAAGKVVTATVSKPVSNTSVRETSEFARTLLVP